MPQSEINPHYRYMVAAQALASLNNTQLPRRPLPQAAHETSEFRNQDIRPWLPGSPRMSPATQERTYGRPFAAAAAAVVQDSQPQPTTTAAAATAAAAAAPATAAAAAAAAQKST